jgi:signal transduction histidine kinase
MSLTQPSRLSPLARGGVAAFDAIDIRAQLKDRPRRAMRVADEQRALAALAEEMAVNPRNMLQKLAEIAVELCEAHSAGISLIDGDLVRNAAVAGAFAAARGGTTPRDQSPSGVCIDRDDTQLLHFPDRCFPQSPNEPRIVETMLIPFHAHGKPVGTVWIVSHTEDRKFDAEDERIITLLSKFASAGWQLLQASDAGATHNRRKDDVLAVLGHELRTPLGAIVAATEIAKRRANDDLHVQQSLDMIVRQSRVIARLADDLLDIARIERGKLVLERQLVDLRTVVMDAVDAIQPHIARRRHTLNVMLGNDALFADADVVRLTQAISNLLDNAAKYTPEGGEVSVVMSSDGDRGVIAVCDNGSGVSPLEAERIFEPFTQLSGSSREAEGGLGLGLALVKSLVELHDGTVSVARNDGPNGSCFTVRIPLISKPTADRRRR